MTIQRTIDLVQEINAEISQTVYAPALERYPSVLDTGNLPIALTVLENDTFQGRNGDNQATSEYVIKVIYEALGQSEFGEKMGKWAEIYEAYRTKYLDPDTFKIVDPDGTTFNPAQRMVLQLTPYHIEISQPLRGTGLQAVEYPINSDFWWHGFEIRFSTTTNWEWDCD